MLHERRNITLHREKYKKKLHLILMTDSMEMKRSIGSETTRMHVLSY